MTAILQDLSAPALTAAIKLNLYEFFRCLQHAARAEFFADDRLARWRTPIDHSWFNGVLSIQPADPHADHAIRETIEYFKSRQTIAFSWWFEPTVPIEGWHPLLMRHGLQLENDTPGMAVDLSKINEDIKTPPNFNLRSVATEADLKVWTQTFVTGYGLPLEWLTGLAQIMFDLGLDWPLQNYTGYLNDQPVATVTLFLGAGVAGILNVATLPEARGQGLGAAMTLQPLLTARSKGYRAGILQSSDLGFNVYRRLGFKQLCTMDHYVWNAKGVE